MSKINQRIEWCRENNTLEPPRDLIIKGNNKTYVNDPRKEESERRNFNLGSFVNTLKSRYKYTKFECDPSYKKYFQEAGNKQIRKIEDEEIESNELYNFEKVNRIGGGIFGGNIETLKLWIKDYYNIFQKHIDNNLFINMIENR